MIILDKFYLRYMDFYSSKNCLSEDRKHENGQNMLVFNLNKFNTTFKFKIQIRYI